MAEECEMKTRNEEFNEFNAHRFVWDTFWNELHCVESKWSADEALYVHVHITYMTYAYIHYIHTYIHAHTVRLSLICVNKEFMIL